MSVNLWGGRSQTNERVLVKQILRADTLLLESGETIKLIGLKAPNPPPRRKTPRRNEFGFVIEAESSPESTLAEKAFAFVKDLWEGQSMRLEFDILKTDINLMTLAYVFGEDGTLVNLEILRQGYAYLNISFPNTKYENELWGAYQEAWEKKRGVHGQ